MYSLQVKFNNEIIYYRHLTYYIYSVKPKMVIFLLGNSWEFQEHDILTFSLSHVNNQDLRLMEQSLRRLVVEGHH